MRRSLQLKQKRNERVAAAQAILDASTELTAEQRTQFDAIQAEIVTLNSDIQRAEFAEAQAAEVTSIEPEARIPRTMGPQPTAVVEVGEPPRFKNLVENLLAIMASAKDPQNTHPRIRAIQAAASGSQEAVDSQGGYLLEPTFTESLMTNAYNLGQIMSRVRRIPLGPNSTKLQIKMVDETDRATGSRYGGLQMYWIGEGTAATATKPTYRMAELNLHKLGGLHYSTDELLQDTTAHSALISQGFTEEAIFFIEDAFMSGNGVNKPKGIIGAGGTVSVNAETNQAAATINTDNLSKMWARMHPRAKTNAVWMINTDCNPQLDKLALAVGTGGLEPRFVNYGPDGIMRIKGRPVIETEYNPTLGTVGDIILADWSKYLVIEKGGLQSAVSVHVLFTTDETTFRFIYRIDGQPEKIKPLTPYKGAANTQGDFVVLATRS